MMQGLQKMESSHSSGDGNTSKEQFLSKYPTKERKEINISSISMFDIHLSQFCKLQTTHRKRFQIMIVTYYYWEGFCWDPFWKCSLTTVDLHNRVKSFRDNIEHNIAK